MILAGVAATAAMSLTAIHERRQQAASYHCQQTSGDGCDGLKANIRSADANEDSVDLAVWALALNLLGIVGLGFTIYYAHRAWKEAQRSANAAHQTLEHARVDAAAQADRFKQQLRLSQEEVALTRDAIVSADRAWLKLYVGITSPLDFQGDRITLGVHCTAENIGNSPATNIIWDWGFYADAGAMHAKIAESTRANPFSVVLPLGQVLFPGDKHNIPLDLKMDRNGFVEAAKEWSADPENAGRGLFPGLYVGLQYALPGDGRRRFTYLVYYVRQSGPGPFGFDGSEGSWPHTSLVLVPDSIPGPIT